MLTIGSLFSGIGGLEKGLEDAGCGSVVWQVEQNAFCRSVLAKHWPHAERFDDVCSVGLDNLTPVGIICGGFPCTDLSYAGKGAGLAGKHSGLWREYARIVRELRPRFVVVENVPALLSRGLGTVLGDLAALGYDAEWHCVRASDVGAPHRRERLFVVAYAVRDEPERSGEPGDVAGKARGAQGETSERQRVWDPAGGGGQTVAPAYIARLEGRGESERSGGDERVAGQSGAARPNDSAAGISESGLGLSTTRLSGRVARCPGPSKGEPKEVHYRTHRWPAGPGEEQHPWEAPRTVQRCDNRAARLKALGNAVVPQVAEVVGRIVMRIARERGLP